MLTESIFHLGWMCGLAAGLCLGALFTCIVVWLHSSKR